jgi:hypothetical protein
MSEDGKQITSLTKEYRFTQEELSILDPLNKRKKTIEQDINNFVIKKVIPRLNLGSNQKYKIVFDIDKNSLRIKHMVPYMGVDRTNWQDVLGMGKATPAR